MSIRLDVPCLVQRIHLVGFVVAKNVDAKIVLLLNLLDVTKWCWELYVAEIQFMFIAFILCYSLCILVEFHRMKKCNYAPYNTLLVFILDVEYSRGFLNLRWRWNVGASIKRFVSDDVQLYVDDLF